MSKRKKGSLSHQQAEQFMKVATVLLRDDSPMSLSDCIETMVYCWRHTESESQAKRRLAGSKP